MISGEVLKYLNGFLLAIRRNYEDLFDPSSFSDNNIEMAFSKLKANLRRIGARTFEQMFDTLTGICELFTPDQCWNLFC